MEKEKNNNKKSELNIGMCIVICAMIAALSFFGAIMMLSIQETWSAVVVILGAVFVGSVGILASLVMTQLRRDQKQKDAEYDEIYKAQKASYLVLKRNFEELSDLLYDMEENGSLPTDEIINAQKAIAKVTISRSKENADALMSSNDMLMNQVFGFEEKLNNNNAEIRTHNEQIIDKLRQEINTSNSEIKNKLENVNDAVKNMQHSISSLEKSQVGMGAQPLMMAVQAMQPMQGGYAMPQQMAPMPQPMMNPVMQQPVVENVQPPGGSPCTSFRAGARCRACCRAGNSFRARTSSRSNARAGARCGSGS